MATDDLFAEAMGDDDMTLQGDPAGQDPHALGGPDAAAPGPAPVAPRTQKPRSNVYTMMLIVSLAAIVTSCIVLYLQLSEYGAYPWWEVPADVTAEVGA